MLVIHRSLQQTMTYHDDAIQHVDGQAGLDKLLDSLHEQATHDDYPHSVVIYAGERYPEEGHGDAGGWIPADPGDGDRPELCLVVGAQQSPLYWTSADGARSTSTGPATSDEPELEYFHGGQESYAPASSLIPTEQAREAARQFIACNGKRPGNITWRTAQPA